MSFFPSPYSAGSPSLEAQPGMFSVLTTSNVVMNHCFGDVWIEAALRQPLQASRRNLSDRFCMMKPDIDMRRVLKKHTDGMFMRYRKGHALMEELG